MCDTIAGYQCAMQNKIVSIYNVQQLENGFSEFSKNFTNEFQTNLQNFQLPNLEELSQFSRNVTKDFKSNLKGLSMFSKNASANLQNIANC